MLKLIWIPARNGAAAPDEAAYKNAVDTLCVNDTTNVIAQFPRDPAQPAPDLQALSDTVKQWLANRSVPNASAKLMMHGYSYDPRHVGDPAYDPFTLVYGYPGDGGPNPRLSWLPLVEECDDAGRRRQETAIAFAWVSTGTFAEFGTAGWSDSYQYACVDLAPLAATAAAAVLRVIGEAGVHADVLAHSLGTRLFTKAVAVLGANDQMIEDVILLDGAEFSVDAAATFAGRSFNVINVANTVDAVLTIGGEQLGDPSRVPGSVESCCLGRFGLGKPQSWSANYPPNWVDLSLDRRDLHAWFKANGGYTLTATDSDGVHPKGNLNHWASYTEVGNRAWLTDLLWRPGLNGDTFAKTGGLPKGVLGDVQPVFAGVGIPQSTPMTMADRMRYQRGIGQGGVG